MTDPDLQEILDQLTAQCGCYEQMLALNAQHALTGDTSQLAQFASDKAALMTRIEVHDERLLPFKRDWPSLRTSLTPDWIEKLQAKMDDLRAALKGLIDGENELLAQFTSRKQQLKGEFDALAKARKVPTAYRQAGGGTSQHFDETK